MSEKLTYIELRGAYITQWKKDNPRKQIRVVTAVVKVEELCQFYHNSIDDLVDDVVENIKTSLVAWKHRNDVSYEFRTNPYNDYNDDGVAHLVAIHPEEEGDNAYNMRVETAWNDYFMQLETRAEIEARMKLEKLESALINSKKTQASLEEKIAALKGETNA